MATHSSTLAWRIPWREEPGRLQSVGLQRVGYNWVTSLHFTLIKKMPLSKLIFLPPNKMKLIFQVFYGLHWNFILFFSSVQFSSVAQSCLTLCDPMDYSMPGPPVHHQLPEFTQTHVQSQWCHPTVSFNHFPFDGRRFPITSFDNSAHSALRSNYCDIIRTSLSWLQKELVCNPKSHWLPG